MAGTKGYRSYRGKTSTSKKVMIGVLCALLLGSLVFLFIMQRYVVYDSDGSTRYEFPWRSEKKQKQELSADDLEIVIEEPQPLEETPLPTETEMHAVELDASVLHGGTESALQSLGEQGANAFAVRVKENSTGRLLYSSGIEQAARAGAVAGNTVSDGALQDLLNAPYYSIARISALHDSAFAASYPIEAAVLQIQHPYVVWYAPDSTFWLAPEKELTRSYLSSVAAECAQLGFDELLFDSFAYPAEGRLSNIDTAQRTMKPHEALTLLAKDIRAAVGDETKLSVVLDAETVRSGADEVKGQVVSELAEYFDRIYVAAAKDELPALRSAVEGCEIVLMTDSAAEGSYLIRK